MNQSTSWLRELKIRLKEIGLTIDGLAYFRKINKATTIIAIDNNGEYLPVGLNEDNHGYLRLVSSPTYSDYEPIDSCSIVQQKQSTIALVIRLYRDYDIESLSHKIKTSLLNLKTIDALSFISESYDKQTILNEELLKENDYSMYKITFRVSEIFIADDCSEQPYCINPLNYCES